MFNKIKLFLSVAVLAMATIFFVGCTKPQGPDVKITSWDFELTVGETATVETEVKHYQGFLIWTSDNLEVATVEDGVITAVGAGEATITVKAGEAQATVKVTVTGANTVNVSFSVNGEAKTQAVELGKPVAKPKDPELANHVFLGWFVDEAGTKAFNFNQAIDEDVTIYAKFTNEAKVIFMDGQEVLSEATVKLGEYISKPADPEKVDHHFDGWYATFNFTAPFEFTTPVKELEIKVYARFAKIKYADYTIAYYFFDKARQQYLEDETKREVLQAEIGTKVHIQMKPFDNWEPRPNSKQEFTIEILEDGSASVRFYYIRSQIHLEFNGGGISYATRQEMVDDFLHDYSVFRNVKNPDGTLRMVTTADLEAFAAFADIDMVDFVYSSARMTQKWHWISKYLGEVGSGANGPRCANMAISPTRDAFERNKKDGNDIYAIAYEFRAFIGGFHFTKNFNGWQSKDYAIHELAHGFWTVMEQERGMTKLDCAEDLVVPNPNREGHDFLGWFDNPEFTGEPVTITKPGTYYAKWGDLVQMESITVTNAPTVELELDQEYQLEWTVEPANVYFKDVLFQTTNAAVASVTPQGLVKTIGSGDASIIIKSSLFGTTVVVNISVKWTPALTISFAEVDYQGFLPLNGTVTIVLESIGGLDVSGVTIASTTPDIIKVEGNVLTGLAEGKGQVTITFNDVVHTLDIDVRQDATGEMANLFKRLEAFNNPLAKPINVTLVNYGPERYYQANYYRPNFYVFDDLVIDSTQMIDKPNSEEPLRTETHKVEFITVHDTANPKMGAKAHRTYFASAKNLSIHYIVGDELVLASLPEKYVGWHAGDGTTPFYWVDTGVNAVGDSAPVFDINQATGKYTVNGQPTDIDSPRGAEGEILTKASFSDLGPTWKIEGGKYFMGRTWFHSGYKKIGSRGGNFNSIGIEMCVNEDGDIFDTWFRNAKLVAHLLHKYSLPISRVAKHNSFSGKDCPATLRAHPEMWDVFMEMVQFELDLLTTYVGAKITLIPKDTTQLSANGRLLIKPEHTTVVSYDIQIEYKGVTETRSYSTIVKGLDSWTQLNGKFPVIH